MIKSLLKVNTYLDVSMQTLENKTIHIEIEKQMSLKIIGDTTILVESKTNDEELEMKINPDFIT